MTSDDQLSASWSALQDTGVIETHQLLPHRTARRLLAILAHPDDESFLIPGTLAAAAAQGVQVHLLCATRGECGVQPGEAGGEAPAVLRTRELLAAAEALGIAAVHLLPYHDSGMAGAPSDHPRTLRCAPLGEVARLVGVALTALQPDVVVSFGPYGGYGHPDHIAVHQATRVAFGAAQWSRSLGRTTPGWRHASSS